MIGFGQQVVGEGAHEAADGFLEVVAVNTGGAATITANDEMDPDEVAFGKVRVVGGNAALIDLGKVGADGGARLRGVAIAGDIDEHRDEIVEAVDARQHADARPVGERCDAGGELEQQVAADLEEFVTRIRIERRHEGLVGMAAGLVAGAAHDLGHLAADQRNFGMRGSERHRGKEPDDAQLAGDLAALAVELDADVIHVGAAVDAGAHIGLGDHQRLGVGEERHVLVRHLDIVGARTQEMIVAILEQSEAGGQQRQQLAVGAFAFDAVFAHAEEGEIVLCQPGEEGQGLAGSGLCCTGRMKLPLVLDALEPLEHAAPALCRARDLGERAFDIRQHSVARRLIGQGLDVDQQRALGDADGGRFIEQAMRFRIEMEHRVAHEPDDAAPGANCGQH